ncbi:ABC transporter transmembrane domain-containing protein [Streptomyces sp. NRRL B-24484]|uniref:ABC transporter transmembrane domain-containing protein n=1 Tax=Streptomyces sp. NRRL B-24484 TaxID=1463833 RepID=UPI0006936451|nr:ABC transporter transmembrane domain-containing protein [Streptomyces sp. NRRL B-24484]
MRLPRGLKPPTVQEQGPATMLPVARPATVRAYVRLLARRHRGGFTAVVALHSVATLAGLVGPWVLGSLVESLSAGTTEGRILTAVGWYLAALVVQSVFIGLSRLRGSILGEEVLADLREDFLVRSVALPPGVLERAGTGDLVSRGTTDIDRLAKSVREAVPELAVAVVSVVLVLGALVLTAPLLAATALIGLPLLLAGSRWYFRRAPQSYRAESAGYAAVNTVLAETVDAGRTVETLQHWLDKLGPTTLRFAWAAALLGTDIRQSLAAAISAQGPDQAEESVRLLRRQRVLTSQPNGRLEFVHPLIGTSIYLTMPAATKTAMHGIAATAIENAGGSMLAASRHLLEVLPEGDDAIVRKLRKAAQEHLAIGAPDAAKRCLERALNEPPDEDIRAEVMYELGCSALLTDPAATVNQLTVALEPENGLSPALRVDATFRLSEALAHAGQLTRAAAVCQEEALRTPQGPGRLRLQAAHFMWAAFQREEDDAVGRSERLEQLAASVTGRDSAERALLAMRAWDLTLRGASAASAVELADRALVNGRLPAELGWTGTTWGFELPALVGLTLTYTDELIRAERLFSDAIMEFEVAGWSGAHRGFAYFLMGLVRFRRGFLLEAEDFLRRGLRISERIAPDLPLQWDIVGVLADTLLARGRVQEAWELAEQYRFAPPYHETAMVLPDAPTLYGKLLLARGELTEAAEVLRQVGEQLTARDRHNTVWAPWAGHLALALLPDEPDEARKYAQLGVDRARTFGSASAVGAALRLQAAVSEGPVVVELLEEAVAVLGQSPAGHEHAHALVDLGAALRRSGRLVDAGEYLYQGMELAQQCGADGLVARARRELAVSGLRPNRLRTLTKDALSQHEWEVAELAVRGLPPQRIAEHLDLPLSLVHRRLAAVHRKAGTGPEGLAAALGLPDKDTHTGDGD